MNRLLFALLLFITTIAAQDWELKLTLDDANIDYSDIAVFDDIVVVYHRQSNTFYISKDGAETWSSEQEIGSEQNVRFRSFKFFDENNAVVYLNSDDYSSDFIFTSTNGGETWSEVTSNISSMFPAIDSLNIGFVEYGHSSAMYVSVSEKDSSNYYLLKSNDYGQSWTVLTEVEHLSRLAFTSDDVGVYSAVEDFSNEFYKTDDGGTTWANIGPDNVNVFNNRAELHFNGDYLYYVRAGTIDKTFLRSSVTELSFESFAEYETINEFSLADDIIAYIDRIQTTGLTFLLYTSTDGGTNWNSLGQIDQLAGTIGLSFVFPIGLNFSSSTVGYLLLHGNNQTYVAKTSNSGGVTSVEEDTKSKPLSFNLSQNYPNPFNPSTVINYSIPEQSNVSLKVFDILGKEVAELVNSEKAAGSYRVNFDATNLASGIYMYKVTAGQFNQVKKMMVIK